MNEVPPALISDLVALGECGDADSSLRDGILARLKPFERVNWLGWKDWSTILEPFDEARARNLVRGPDPR